MVRKSVSFFGIYEPSLLSLYDRIGQYKTWTADYGLRTGYKIRTRYETRTGKYRLGIKHGLGIKRGLQTVDLV